jgi:hypothetical protein
MRVHGVFQTSTRQRPDRRKTCPGPSRPQTPATTIALRPLAFKARKSRVADVCFGRGPSLAEGRLASEEVNSASFPQYSGLLHLPLRVWGNEWAIFSTRWL